MAHVLLACHADYQLNLIEGSDDKLLAPFPPAIGRYVEKRLFDSESPLLKSKFYKGKQGRDILLENNHSGDTSVHASDLALLLLGKKPELLLHANSSGQVVLIIKSLRIFLQRAIALIMMTLVPNMMNVTISPAQR